MKIIGLTGGIGSGKSTVLELFKFLGVKTYSADESAKKLVNTDPYGDGWMIKVLVSDFTQLDSLLSANQYKELLGV